MLTVTGGKLSHVNTATNVGERTYDPIPSMPSDVINRLDEIIGNVYEINYPKK